jgi:hypothetical protein
VDRILKMPWEKVRKVSHRHHHHQHGAGSRKRPNANDNGTRLEAVTKDQLNTGLTGQIRYHVSENNLYAFLYGIKQPFVHVMAILRLGTAAKRIANFEANPKIPARPTAPARWRRWPAAK